MRRIVGDWRPYVVSQGQTHDTEKLFRAAGGSVIVWVANTPTPQFAEILNHLADDTKLDIRAYYRRAEDGDRGWGDLSLSHAYETLEPKQSVRNLIRGGRIGMNPTIRAVVVFGYTSPFAIGLLLTSRIRGIPIFTQSDSDGAATARMNPIKRIVKQAFLRSVYPRNTRVWVIGKNNAEYWSYFGLNNQSFIPFESPIPENELIPGICADICSSTKRNDHDRIVLYVGRISPEKCVKDLIDSLRALNRSKESRYRCLIVGRGDTDSLGVGPADEFVHIMGALPHDQLAAAYLAADVLVLPSEREPYGLVVREALQFGLPVVATSAVPSALQLCDKGWNIVPPRNPLALAAAVFRACDEERWPALEVVDTATTYADELAWTVQRDMEGQEL